jgi:ribosome-associated protein
MVIEITEKIHIPDDQLVFKFSRSSGPGGQNVNKVNTKVAVFFNVAASDNFTDAQKRRILKQLAGRINKQGLIKVTSQRYRTQKANRAAAIDRLAELLSCAIKRKPVRKKTKVPTSSKEKRLAEKKRRSLLKQQRTKVNLQ